MVVHQINENAITTIAPSKNMPFTIQGNQDIDIFSYGRDNKEQLNNLLLEHGAVLLRGFPIEGPKDFSTLFQTITAGGAIEYKNRTSPRDKVYDNVYTSTSHPKDQVIHMHTENSYSKVYNRIISFYCLVPPEEGGQTPIADERKIATILDSKFVEKFREKGIRYVRNSMPGIELDWKTIYQTDDKEKVNETLRQNNYDYEWVSKDHLRLKWELPAFQKHPVTGEEMWFNHMYFGHKSLYHPGVVEYFKEENLPFATYYGDGSDIEAEAIAQIKAYYEEQSLVFDWQKNDFLLLDNMMFSHGRKSFKGKRKILTAMGQPHEFVF